MIDFTELPEDGKAFEQLIREILLLADLHPQWSGLGPDQGRDIIATENAVGSLDQFERRWLVQCKHFAHGGRSVGRADVGSVVDDCRQVGASGYLLVCSTQPSSSLVTKLDEISNRPENGIRTKVWDSVDVERRIAEPRNFSLGHLFFPRSFATTPWKIYNDGAPNNWTANYRDYFIHLSSRISGRHPELSECEEIIRRLEAIHPCGPSESVRPRAIYYDDKHDQFAVFADYLVPRGAEPSLSPQDFEDELHDWQGLHSDGVGMWKITAWDIQLRRIIPHSDHFDLDHYDFYVPHRATYRVGFPRGEYFIGETARYGNRWNA